MLKISVTLLATATLLSACTYYEPPPGYAYYPVACPPNATASTSAAGANSPTVAAPAPQPSAPSGSDAPPPSIGTISPAPPPAGANPQIVVTGSTPAGPTCAILTPAGYAYPYPYYYPYPPGYYYGPAYWGEFGWRGRWR
jgi:hypothetical protein